MSPIIDLDAQATTPLCPEARAAMRPWIDGTGPDWNPHGAHAGARAARAVVETARAQVAGLLGADPAGLIFTGGATEAVNLAIKGALLAAPAARTRVVTFATEHSCVLESVAWLGRVGFQATILPVLPDGLPAMDAYRAALGPDVALVAAMRVNNEVGTILPVADLAQAAHAAGALLLIDAAQGFGKVPCEVDGLGADMIAVSAHKLHGPKGIGALWARPGLALEPVLHGGGQERARSGTLSPMLCAGFGAAAAAADPARDSAHADALWNAAMGALAGTRHRINGAIDQRWRGNLSLTLPGVDATALVSRVRGVALSTGSACGATDAKPSHVLRALGLSAADVRSTLRLGWHRFTTEADVREGIALVLAAAGQRAAA